MKSSWRKILAVSHSLISQKEAFLSVLSHEIKLLSTIHTMKKIIYNQPANEDGILNLPIQKSGGLHLQATKILQGIFFLSKKVVMNLIE